MKQRVLLLQALLNDPKFLILDEPTAGLDPKERIRIRNLISDLSEDRIVLIATHVVSDIEFISKEILLMKTGDWWIRTARKICKRGFTVMFMNCASARMNWRK